VTLFGNKIFAEIIKLGPNPTLKGGTKISHSRGRKIAGLDPAWAGYPRRSCHKQTNKQKRSGGSLDTEAHTEEGQCKDIQGECHVKTETWSEGSISQKCLRLPGARIET
jgi:hypothetical protein